MRAIQPSVPDLHAVRLRMRERRWMLAVTCVVVFGLALVWRARTAEFERVERLIASGAIVDLSRAPGADALHPVVALAYPDSAVATAVSAHIAARLAERRRGGLLASRAVTHAGLLRTRAFALDEAAARSGAGAPGATLFPDARSWAVVKARLVARGPGAFRRAAGAVIALYVLALWALHAFWFARRAAVDPLLLPALHLLSGMGLMLHLSLPDPLRDTLRAEAFVGGVAAAAVCVAVTSRVDFGRPVWRRRPWAWLAAAGVLALALFVWGEGPTGSQARVNLRMGPLGTLQPVEGIKLAVLVFLSGYFARNAELLRELQARARVARLLPTPPPRARDALPVAAGIALALLACLLLRDMGPALVLACTFLVLWAAARGRVGGAAAGAIGLAGSFVWVHHTAIVPRIAGRVEMLVSPWDNLARGGEHLAHAYWAMATGGMTGQGLGRGLGRVIPAAHTDFVLPALAEEAGLVGLLAVIGVFGVLLARGLRISRRAGSPFASYLALGITVLTLFQLVLIAGGTLGVVPLSGVVTPFLSFGRSSMLVHGTLLGALASVSAHAATLAAPAMEAAPGAPRLRGVGALAALLLLGLAGRAAYVQGVRADDWSLRPALVLRADGQRAFVYNPRIRAVGDALTRGSIYDRNGLPLVTSRGDELRAHAAALAALGADTTRSPLRRRHYPLGALTFYLLGDLESRVKWGADNSLYAEHAYLSHLRGYDNAPRRVDGDGGAAAALVRYDYGALRPLLRHGRGHPDAEALLARERDLHLTIDARLQRAVADILAGALPDTVTASVVVLDAATGEVLASVMHPLPHAAYADAARAHADPELFDRGWGQGAKAPGSTFKLVTAMAALRADDAAAGWTRDVAGWERYARRGEPRGRVGMGRALAASSNVYFAALARDVAGADTLAALADAFGFRVGGARDVAEAAALLREPDNLRQAGFGQGPLVGSPLAVARVAGAVANGGVLVPARWVRDSVAVGGAVRVLEAEHAAVLGGHMRSVVTDREGTARGLRGTSVPIAGKTGTAEENVWHAEADTLLRVNHAWFTGFAPYRERPAPGGRTLALAVLVERGGSGGRVAAPLAGQIVDAAAALGLIEAPADLPMP